MPFLMRNRITPIELSTVAGVIEQYEFGFRTFGRRAETLDRGHHVSSIGIKARINGEASVRQ